MSGVFPESIFRNSNDNVAGGTGLQPVREFCFNVNSTDAGQADRLPAKVGSVSHCQAHEGIRRG